MAGGETTWYKINAAMAPQGGETTSMTTEYGGLLKLLALLRAYVGSLQAQNLPLPPGGALLQGDSELVVKQVAGLRAVVDARLLRYHTQVRTALQGFPEAFPIYLQWISRDFNDRADGISKKANEWSGAAETTVNTPERL